MRAAKTNHRLEGGDDESGADTDTAPRATGTRDGQGFVGGAIIVCPAFPLRRRKRSCWRRWKALELGKYERPVMRTSLVCSIRQLGFLNELTI